ncbi:MAG TPA: RidA family protein [Ignavibacteriaceae bacterium]|nr:RidA family protein [Ignavibacteriaceae bacterium]
MKLIEEKLKDLNIEIPEAAKPLAAYIPAIKVDNFVYISGQLPFVNGELKFKGKVGLDVSEDDAQIEASKAVLNCLGAVKSVIGSLDDIEQIVKLTVFVNSANGFTNQPKVANGASELLQKIFGDKGKHTRSAVGVSELPINAPVEIEMIVKVK